MVHRVYVQKKPAFAVEAAALAEELRNFVGIQNLSGLAILHRYDVEGISDELFGQCVQQVFSEPPVDDVLYTLPSAPHIIAVEYLPGQFDQRADSAAECIQLISQGARPLVRTARLFVLEGTLTGADMDALRAYLINPVEARPASLAPVSTLAESYPAPPPVPTLQGFLGATGKAAALLQEEYGLAMDAEDLAFCQSYFKKEGRQPTLAELRVIDTYWSDHCRHTTFGTHLQNILVTDPRVLSSYQNYLALREELYGKNSPRPQTLMDIATIGAKALRARGKLKNLDESDEINACSIKIKADNNGKEEDWLLLFKNETHNHPTEIEPFGGAATCLGGAIRDPLANRGYVYGAMRVTGAGNPLAPVKDTLPGKLPQRKITTGAAAGYASYGNQVGLATGQVTEIYHPGYVAKRLEIGAVLGAAPASHVMRTAPRPGDIVLLLGGRTGRDGCGGATGSSKAHKTESLASCGAEVQKGNPPAERKLQRLFRNPQATRLIRRCNDFGAGGVAVAIGELADGLCINLSALPKKYEGLSGIELAISESQERMAVVVAPQDEAALISLANAENIEATRVAVVTAQPRLVMQWQDETIVDISRDFLNSNGAVKQANVSVPYLPTPAAQSNDATVAQQLSSLVQSLNGCSQKGLAQCFDSTIGAATVLMPFGGRRQLTPAGAMVMKLPVDGETTTCSGMAFGFDPYVSEQNPYTGAYLAVVESVAKLVARGFDANAVTLTFQEYFERLGTNPARWGKPFAALLGALQAQMDLGVAAVGGKDSMSGSFENLDVPPTLVSFAVAAGHAGHITGPEFKLPGSRVVLLHPMRDGLLPSPAAQKLVFTQVQNLLRKGQALGAQALGSKGAAHALFEMGLGNRLGLQFAPGFSAETLFAPAVGSFVLELAQDMDIGETLGYTTAKYEWHINNEVIDLAPMEEMWENVLEPIFPLRTGQATPSPVQALSHSVAPQQRKAPKMGIATPRALIPVFPGTNCEYDTARALRRAGAQPDIFVLNTLTPQAVAQSAAQLAQRIRLAQMVVLPGGFSGGDEPEGSAKLITAFFRGSCVAEALANLMDDRDGLMLGICNGFQALVKLGLLPYGKILPAGPNSPTLTYNTLGRHQSLLAHTRVASNLSPWLMHQEVGAAHTVAISHGEGRFVAEASELNTLAQNGQIATQYVDMAGNPTLALPHNPNGSLCAIEGLSSPDGRILGKMGHTERSGNHLYVNVPGNTHQKLFEGGVDYFKI